MRTVIPEDAIIVSAQIELIGLGTLATAGMDPQRLREGVGREEVGATCLTTERRLERIVVLEGDVISHVDRPITGQWSEGITVASAGIDAASRCIVRD